MIRRFLCLIVSAVSLLMALPVGAQVQPAFYISCEGTESNGGGLTRYQYELLNITNQNILVRDLIVGTEDLNPLDYTNVFAPAGFNFSLVAGSATGTTLVKTPHGSIPVPPNWIAGTAGQAVWTAPGGVLLPPAASFTFGFDNPRPSEDVEWIANGMLGEISIGLPNLPVAGPLGIFTLGPVHGPGIPEPTTLALIALPMVLASRRTR